MLAGEYHAFIDIALFMAYLYQHLHHNYKTSFSKKKEYKIDLIHKIKYLILKLTKVSCHKINLYAFAIHLTYIKYIISRNCLF